MPSILRELRLAGRRLARAPRFTLLAGLTLAVGIGANSAIFSVVNGVLLEPLAYDHPDELVSVGAVAPGLAMTESRLPLSEGFYFTFRDDNRTLADLGLLEQGSVTISGESAPERVTSLTVTDGTLGLLGIRPLLGRLFDRADDVPGAPLTAVLGYGYWQRRYGGDRAVVGKTILIDGAPHQIVGVLPQGTRILEQDPAVAVTARFDPAKSPLLALRYRAVARLKPGVTPSEVTADLDRLIPVAATRYPGGPTLEQLRRLGLAASVEPLKADLVGDVGTVLWVLLGTVALVLLLACANVANLFLVQAEIRQREVALRTALGASRGRIVGDFLTESALLGLGAGVVGLALAALGLRLLGSFGADRLPRMADIAIDGRVLAFTAGVSLLAGVLFGLLPALRYGRRDLHLALKAGGRGIGGGRGDRALGLARWTPTARAHAPAAGRRLRVGQ